MSIAIEVYRYRIGIYSHKKIQKLTSNNCLGERNKLKMMTAILITLALILAGIEQNPGPLTKRSPTQSQIPQSFLKDPVSTPSSQTKRPRPNSSPNLSSPLSLESNLTNPIESVNYLEIIGKLDQIVNQTKNNQKEINIRFDQMQTNFKTLESKYSDLSLKFNEFNPMINNLELTIGTQQKIITDLQHKIDDLENRQRRDNLIFKGIPKLNIKESWSECKETLLSMLGNYLDPSDIIIDRAHRIGKNHAIIAKIPNSDHRTRIFQVANAMRQNKIYIDEDYSKTLQHKRGLLLKKRKEIIAKGGTAKLRYDKLITDEGIYTIENNDDIILRGNEPNDPHNTNDNNEPMENNSVQKN